MFRIENHPSTRSELVGRFNPRIEYLVMPLWLTMNPILHSETRLFSTSLAAVVVPASGIFDCP